MTTSDDFEQRDLPEVLAKRERDGELALDLRIDEDLTWFSGHFPHFAVLPGIVQIGWATHFGQALGYEPARFTGMPRVKFKQVIVPPARISLFLKRRGSRLVFRYESDEGLHSEGSIESMDDDAETEA